MGCDVQFMVAYGLLFRRTLQAMAKEPNGKARAYFLFGPRDILISTDLFSLGSGIPLDATIKLNIKPRVLLLETLFRRSVLASLVLLPYQNGAWTPSHC